VPPNSPDLTYQHPALRDGLPARRSRVSLVLESPRDVTAVALEEGPGLVLGRSEPADVVVDDRSLSRTHARFVLRDGLVHVEDLGSTNGVRLDGERVSTCVLDDADSVELGGVRVLVSGLGGAGDDSPIGGFSRFRLALSGEIERARLFARPFCLLALRRAKEDGEFPRALAGLLRRVDVATSYTADLMLAVLPETSAATAAELARNILARAGLPLAAALVAFPEDATDFEALIEQAMHAARSAKVGSVVRVERTSPAVDDGAPLVVSETMQRVYALVDRVARATLPVLVLGETGAGKELVSRAVHERSARKSGPFVAINCASIPPNLIESVLFGHEKGAFTGATERRAGVFEQAHGGSVFLDEVGELAAPVQAALLRVLETKKVVRVGGTRELEVDVRVIAATHRDLPTMVSQGTFREDLMFRLDALSLRVPPLRERVEEIVPLAMRFLARAEAQWGIGAKILSSEASAALRAYRWPGNVRQLKNVIERAAVVCGDPQISIDDLPAALVAPADVPATGEPPPASARVPLKERTFGPLLEHDANLPFTDRVGAFEARLIREALATTAGNQTKAAALLKIPRRTLTNKIHALGLGPGES
jgi:DNA-binding NtrC family response regulator